MNAPRPQLVIVRGKPGAGKSTLARRLTEPDALGLSLLSRDTPETERRRTLVWFQGSA